MWVFGGRDVETGGSKLISRRFRFIALRSLWLRAMRLAAQRLSVLKGRFPQSLGSRLGIDPKKTPVLWHLKPLLHDSAVYSA